MLEEVVAGLLVHIGAKGVDKVWNAIKKGTPTVVDNEGQFVQTFQDAGRTVIGKELSLGQADWQNDALVLGNLYIPESLRYYLDGSEIALAVIIEEDRQEFFFFSLSTEAGYEIHLPPGYYSFYVFLIDSNAPSPMDADVLAIGLPAAVDLTGLQSLSLSNHQDIWELVHSSPMEIAADTSYSLHLILIDTNQVPELPRRFSDSFALDNGINAIQQYDLTGAWSLKETYDYGYSNAVAYLAQVENSLIGYILIHDTMADGGETILREQVSGQLYGDNLIMEGHDVQLIKGLAQDYYLDRWEGTVENEFRVFGTSVDDVGTQGRFIMDRLVEN